MLMFNMTDTIKRRGRFFIATFTKRDNANDVKEFLVDTADENRVYVMSDKKWHRSKITDWYDFYGDMVVEGYTMRRSGIEEESEVEFA